MYKRIIILLAVFLFYSNIKAQIFINADPFYLLEHEKHSFTTNENDSKNFLIRPFLNQTNKTLYGTWSVGFRTELFFNDNA